MYLEQAKMRFPKMANDEWLILKKGIFAFMPKEKMGSSEPQSKLLTLKTNTPKILFLY
jgi:hypothetical protein